MGDTGATISVISYETVKKLALLKAISRTNESLVGPAGGKLESLGQIEVSFKIDGMKEKFSLSFIVVKNLQFKILLGLDFFKKNDILLDFKSGLIKKGRSTSKLHFFGEKEREHVNATVFNKNIDESSANDNEKWLEKIKIGDVDKENIEKFIDFLVKNEKIFAKSLKDLGTTHILEQEINTIDEVPVTKRPFRLEHSRREAMDQIIDEMLEANILEESTSAYCAPALLVKKSDGSDRLVIDYRSLNEKIVKENNFNLNVNEIFDFLYGKVVFSTLDLRSGYYQIKLAKKDRHKTAFSTQKGHFQYKVSPMGLCHSPTVFQRLMQKVLGKLQYKCLAIFLDDVLVASESIEGHFEDLKKVFHCLREANLKLPPSKCHFSKNNISFLGYKIDERGLQPDESKIEAVKKYPVPRCRRDVKAYLGLVGFYRRFISNFTEISLPLVELTKLKIPFKWSETANESFENLKKRLLCPPILRHPNLEKDFIIFSDASNFSIGCTLAQEDELGRKYAIAYASRKLSQCEVNYNIFEKELVGLVFALNQFHTYIYGRKTTVYIDNNALTYIKNMSLPSGRYLRTILKIQEYDLRIIHHPGSSNVVADALSRIKYTDGDPRVENQNVDFLRGNQPAPSQISKWKVEICKELRIKYDEVKVPTSVLDETSDDYFFDQLSIWLTGRKEHQKELRLLLHRFEQSKRKYFDVNFIKSDLTMSQHLRQLKNKGKATETELQATACLFKIPILLQNSEGEKIFLPSTDSFLKAVPPYGFCLTLKLIKDNVFKIILPKPTNSKTLNAVARDENVVFMPELKQLRRLQEKDTFCKKWIQFLKTGEREGISKNVLNFYKNKLFINDQDILCFKQATKTKRRTKIRIVVPEALIGEVLKTAHNIRAGGHLGRERTWNMVEATCYRPGLRKIVNFYVKNCKNCLEKKARNKDSEVQAEAIETASFPWQHISVDILGPLQKTPRGNKFLLVVVDRFSKWVEAFPLPSTTTVVIAEKLINEIFCRYGICESLLCDNASYFESALFNEIMKQFNINKKLIPCYAARCNAQVERYNLTLINSLKTFSMDEKLNWDTSIHYTLLALRNSVNLSTGETPSFILFGRPLKLPLDLIFHKSMEAENKPAHQYAVDLSEEMKKLDDKVRAVNLEARKRYLTYANRNKKPTKIKPGDIVMIYTPILKKGLSKKLTSTMRGPARVVEKVGKVCFNVKMLTGKKISRVHANRLKLFNPEAEEHVRKTWSAELTDSDNENISESVNEESDAE